MSDNLISSTRDVLVLMRSANGKTYYFYNTDIYVCQSDDIGPIDLTTGMPANVRWECTNTPRNMKYLFGE